MGLIEGDGVNISSLLPFSKRRLEVASATPRLHQIRPAKENQPKSHEK
jgi:hypothetical protein